MQTVWQSRTPSRIPIANVRQQRFNVESHYHIPVSAQGSHGLIDVVPNFDPKKPKPDPATSALKIVSCLVGCHVHIQPHKQPRRLNMQPQLCAHDGQDRLQKVRACVILLPRATIFRNGSSGTNLVEEAQNAVSTAHGEHAIIHAHAATQISAINLGANGIECHQGRNLTAFRSAEPIREHFILVEAKQSPANLLKNFEHGAEH